MTTNNKYYSSSAGTILTMIGVAVGLGNVWRFPYMMGNYGGSAFVLIYLVFTICLAFPALLTEMYLGKNSPSGTIGAYEFLYGSTLGRAAGYLFTSVITIAGSYYAVIVANVIHSAYFSITTGFSEAQNASYQTQLGNGYLQYGITVLLIGTALFVSYKGLKNGIEKISKVIMPFFCLAIIYMIIHAWQLPGAPEKVKAFLTPNFSAITSTEVFAALGQAFYSVGLGGTFVVVYSSYIADSKTIPRIAILTCLGDLGASLLVSFFLVPTILVLGMEMNAGPALIFNTFPELFATLPNGRVIGSLFLVVLSLVAFLSLVGAFQVPISSLSRTDIPVNQLIIGMGFLQSILAFPSALYPQIIGTLDLIFGSGMQVFGSMLAVIGMWWGIKKAHFQELILPQPVTTWGRGFLFWLRWIVPGTLLAVLIGYVYGNM